MINPDAYGIRSWQCDPVETAVALMDGSDVSRVVKGAAREWGAYPIITFRPFPDRRVMLPTAGSAAAWRRRVRLVPSRRAIANAIFDRPLGRFAITASSDDGAVSNPYGVYVAGKGENYSSPSRIAAPDAVIRPLPGMLESYFRETARALTTLFGRRWASRRRRIWKQPCLPGGAIEARVERPDAAVVSAADHSRAGSNSRHSAIALVYHTEIGGVNAAAPAPKTPSESFVSATLAPRQPTIPCRGENGIATPRFSYVRVRAARMTRGHHRHEPTALSGSSTTRFAKVKRVQTCSCALLRS